MTMDTRPASTAPLARAWATALGAGLLVGVATSFLQAMLPGSWNRLANSGAMWTLLAFAVAAYVARTRSESVGAGLFGLLGSVAGYYALASPLRDVATTWDERLLWTAGALVLGPLAGLAADLWLRGARLGRLCGGLAMCGVVVGEALHGIARISSSDLAGWVEFLIAIVTAGVLCRDVRSGRDAAIAGGIGAAVALIVFAAYGLS